jgi:hypothetical protein
MRIYDGSPRQDFEEVFRSIGVFLDARGMRDILLLEVGAATGTWSDAVGTVSKETLSFLDDDIAKFMEEAAGRRGDGAAPETVMGTEASAYEHALRVIGRWMDEQRPKDVFLFEQDGSYVIRLLIAGQSGSHHQLAEFTRDDVVNLVAQAPKFRAHSTAPGK